MQGHYSNAAIALAAKLKRWPLLTLIRSLVRWQPMRDPRPGYTLVISCASPLASMLTANLAAVARQDLTGLERIIIDFDLPADMVVVPIEQRLRADFPDLPLQFRYFTRPQMLVTRLIDWAWVYNWICWCDGVAAARTRYVMLHDLDAMPIKTDYFRQRYEAIRDRKLEFLGTKPYRSHGLIAEDNIMATFELIFDAAYVRQHFTPIQMFKKIQMHRGRSVDLDLFLYPQTVDNRRELMGDEHVEDMVHPNQMISQFTAHVGSRWRSIPPQTNNLMLIPYYLFLAGERPMLAALTRQMQQASDGTIELFGRPLNVSSLKAIHAEWLREQAFRLDAAVAREVRPEVRAYFDTVLALASGGTEGGTSTRKNMQSLSAG